MRFHKKIIYSLVFALIIFFLSLGVKIIPCQTAPEVPNKNYSWNFCSLNPDGHSTIGIHRLYWGYSDKLTDAYFITILLSFILGFGVISLTSRKRKD